MRPKGAGHLKFRRANNNNGNELWMSGMVGGSEREGVWSKAARATKNIAAYLWGRVPRPVDPTPWPQTWGQLNCYISATTLDYILCMQQSLRLVCMCVCVQGWGEAVRLLFVWNVIKDVVMTGWNVNKRRCTGRSLPRCSKDMVYPLHIQRKIYFSLIFLCAIVRKWFF